MFRQVLWTFQTQDSNIITAETTTPKYYQKLELCFESDTLLTLQELAVLEPKLSQSLDPFLSTGGEELPWLLYLFKYKSGLFCSFFLSQHCSLKVEVDLQWRHKKVDP